MKLVMTILTWAAGLGGFVLIGMAEQSGNPVHVLAGGGCIGLVVLLSLLNNRLRRQENEKKPITEAEATVVGHYTRRERVGRTTQIRWYITFRPADGSPNVEFEVSELDFEDYDMGETGPLRYRGWEFLSFGVKDKSDFKPMAPLPEEYEPKPEPESAAQRIGRKLHTLWMSLISPKEKQENVSEPDEGILTHEIDE